MQDVLTGIASKIGGDHTTDLSRILAIPGTFNRKDQRNGKEPILRRLVVCDPARRYPFSDFVRFAEVSPDKQRREKVARVKLPATRKLTASKQDRFAALITASDVAPVGARSEADFSLCCYAVESGMSQADVWGQVSGIGKFRDAGERYFHRTWASAESHTRERIFAKAEKKAERKAAKQSDPEDDRPEIIIGTDESRVVDQAIAAIATRPIFQRGGMLVHIVRDAEPPRGIARTKDAPRIANIRTATVREHLADAADWLAAKSADSPEGDQVGRVHPPAWAVAALEARGQWRGIRRLEAVVETPVLRADGTVLQSPGYDPETGLLFEPRATFPPVPDSPSKADAERAVCDLCRVVEDFPFQKPEHRAAWLAGVLTPLARFAFYGPAPLFLADANAAGTGKGLLIEVTGRIATGRFASMAANSLPANPV